MEYLHLVSWACSLFFVVVFTPVMIIAWAAKVGWRRYLANKEDVE